MNEILFLSHVVIVIIITLGALRLGRETLMSLVALQAVLANLFVLKRTMLFGFDVTCADVYAVGGILGLNLLNEYYGNKVARDTVWVSFSAMVLFGIMSQLHLAYIPSISDFSQQHFLTLLTPAPRILIASFAAYFISSRFDVWFYGILKRNDILLRSSISLIITQFLDTVLFTFLGLYGLLPSVTGIILVSYIIKLIVISISVPFNALSRVVHD